MRSIVGLVVAILAIACAKADEPCLKTDNARFNAAIPPELAAKGIKHRFDDQRGVCVDKKDAAALEAAYRRITMYSSEVAALLSDECEQRDLIEWAKRENIPFEVNPTTKPDGSPGGNMFNVRAVSAQEVAIYREKLNRHLPEVKSCKS